MAPRPARALAATEPDALRGPAAAIPVAVLLA